MIVRSVGTIRELFLYGMPTSATQHVAQKACNLIN